MSILLDIGYAAVIILLSPWWLYRMIRYGRYRDGIAERFGASPVRYGLQPVIWLHGVSLGEVNGLASVVRELHSQLPDYSVVISTSTDTGLAGARRLFAPAHTVFSWPLDFSLVVRRSLNRVRPDLVVLMEGDVWPNFLAACNRRNIPVVVVNGRMSPDKGYPGYKKLGPLAAGLFNRLTAIGVQNEAYAECFRKLGTRSDKVRVTGMMKFDTVQVADSLEGQEELAAAMEIEPADRLIVAGGTGPGEEKILLDVFARLRVDGKHPDARLARTLQRSCETDNGQRIVGDPPQPTGRRFAPGRCERCDNPWRYDGRVAEVLRVGVVRVRGSIVRADGRFGHDRSRRPG